MKQLVDGKWLVRAEESQPWVLYVYGLTHDGLWPLRTSTRLLGYARIRCECMVCGDRTVMQLPIPRLRRVPRPANGRHPARENYLRAHEHPDRGHPIFWAQPLRNLHAIRDQPWTAAVGP